MEWTEQKLSEWKDDTSDFYKSKTLTEALSKLEVYFNKYDCYFVPQESFDEKGAARMMKNFLIKLEKPESNPCPYK